MSNKTKLLPELFNQYPDLTSQEIDLSITLMTSRVFNYCKNKNLIDHINSDEDGKRKKVKLNYFEAFWILIIQELRTFGLSDKYILGIKAYLHEVIWDFVEDNETGREFLKQTLTKNPQLDYGYDVEKEFPKFLQSIKNLSKLERNYASNLGSFINLLLLTNESPTIVFKANLDPETKEEMPIRGFLETDLIDITPKAYQLSDATILLPLRPLFEKLFDWEIKDESLLKFQLISEKEKEILEILRSGDYKEMIIKPGKDEPILHIKSSGSIKGDKVKEIRKILGLKEYESVTLKSRNHKDIYFENTQKK